MVTEWEKGDELEQISTSGVEILTLLLSLVIIFGLVLSNLGKIPSDWNITLFIITLRIILAIHRLSEFRSKKLPISTKLAVMHSLNLLELLI